MCPKNTKTCVKGKLSETSEAGAANDKSYKKLTAPIRAEERLAWHISKAPVVFVNLATRNRQVLE